ncbi:peroxidase family protein [Sphingomonas abietis]|uniref:Heme peroxidase family protein n=1 Tax=Sphingomonas abietis TaxID=3012344 RepID=A0ABY7NQK9_9SPHN|nr:heme peroxidase family protein [Sphingomonas abietis]WBO23839.1 heme peroxidase family protein [Sphingomonas abietis]
MASPPIVRPHGGVRGANLSRSSLLFGGPFGRMFRALPAAEFGSDDEATIVALTALAAGMLAKHDPPFDGPDAEEGGIPAAYTYFGQFIDHDLTFDPASSLQKQNDLDALVDYRTPRFDLDNVYGRGPDDQPYLYSDGLHFNLGRALTGAAHNPKAQDLPRSNPVPTAAHPHPTKRAIIGDPRNDENVIVSQLQGLFLRLHNSFATKLGDFSAAQKAVRWHYQWVVLNDFLPKIVAPAVLAEILPHLASGDLVGDPPKLKFYHARDEAFMPLEFSAAAYRFGHSMVRPEYQLNETLQKPHSIFAGNTNQPNLRGFHEFPAQWAIDWRFFIDLEVIDYGDPDNLPDPRNKNRVQLAYKIDTSLVNPLGHLPKDVAENPHILALRNLERGWRMRLPSGQDVARAMGVVPLDDSQIKIGKFTVVADDQSAQRPITDFGAAFAGNCPLWTYVLAETVQTTMTIATTQGDQVIDTRQLGEVGGRIVAETMVGLLLADSSSFLVQDPRWKPDASLMKDGKFGLRELIAAALDD